jgi:hypothetical protein
MYIYYVIVYNLQIIKSIKSGICIKVLIDVAIFDKFSIWKKAYVYFWKTDISYDRYIYKNNSYEREFSRKWKITNQLIYAIAK